MSNQEERLVKEKEAAHILGVSDGTLRNERYRARKENRLPLIPYLTQGRNIYYRMSDLMNYINTKTTTYLSGESHV